MNMKLTKQAQSSDKLQLTFNVEGTNEAFVNTIRRMVTEEVPTLAVEDVEFKDNSSALFDEMLALRLGLIPIKTDLQSYELPSSEADIEEKSAKCTLQLSLKVAKKGMVLASDAQSKDPNCTFVYADMPIVKLIAKQKVDLNMLAVMGQGKEHTKWSPGLMTFGQNAKITIKNDEKLIKEYQDKFPSQIFDKSGKISEKLILENNLLDAVDRVCEEVVKVEYLPESFHATIESWGQLSCNEILETAATMLAEKAKEMESLL